MAVATLDPPSSTGPGELVTAPPCAMTIFGATGDLTARLLMPSLYNLAKAKHLSDRFAVIGTGRTEWDDDAFRGEMVKALRTYASADETCPVCDWLADRLYYVRGDIGSDQTFAGVRQRLAEVAERHGTAGNVLFYMATAPRFFAPAIQKLGAAGLTQEDDGFRRVIIEKPFGHDLESARALNRDLQAVLAEEQIFRIDHYLGKETVQNLLVLRFANGLFEPLWNRVHIDSVQITVAETVGVESRGDFYDKTGALRDMVPNHIFQLLALTAMEPPSVMTGEAVREEKSKVLASVRRYTPDEVRNNVVRAQYVGGRGANGRAAIAYRGEPEVDPDSITETFVAMQLTIDNWRWAGTPFYLRTGKRLGKKRSEIAIHFRRPPTRMFRDTGIPEDIVPNRLILKIQPDEGVSIDFGAKVPGSSMRLGEVAMAFHYKDYFNAPPGTGYERLLHDAMEGDPTLFQRADFVEGGWRVIQSVLDAWSEGATGLAAYAAGGGGPREAEELLAREGRSWMPLK